MKGQARLGRKFGALMLPGAVEIRAAYRRTGLWQGWMEDVPHPALDALIDTGASRSCLPAALTDRGEGGFPLLRVDTRRPSDWTGRASAHGVPVFLVRVHVMGVGPLEAKVLPTDLPYFVLGRDLLSHFLMVLDGPSGAFCLRRTGGVDRFLRKLLRCP